MPAGSAINAHYISEKVITDLCLLFLSDHGQNSGKVPHPSEGATKNASVTLVHTGMDEDRVNLRRCIFRHTVESNFLLCKF